MGNITRLFRPRRPDVAGSAPPSGQNLLTTLKTGVPAAGGLARLLQGSTGSGKEEATARTALFDKPRAGRLAFVIDATESRSHAWREAQKIQRRMVQETRRFGRLQLRVVHFRGGHIPGSARVEAYPDHWTTDPDQLTAYMDKITCVRGHTQIARSLEECILRFKPEPTAIVAIGDCCEESTGWLRSTARELCARKIPVFAFFDGDDHEGEAAYRMLAAETNGVSARFGDRLNLSSLIVAAGAYVAGGASALLELAHGRSHDRAAALEFVHQLKLPPPRR